MNKDPRNPFNWRLRTGPSIFATDPYFKAKADGKTNSQRATDTVENRRKNGDDPSTLYGIGRTTKEKEEKMLAYKQFGIYSRAKASSKRPNKHEQ